VKSDVGCCFRDRMDGQREMYQLDLNIVGLQFSHHPLFSQEHVLCARLLRLCESLQDRQRQSVSQLLYEKVRRLSRVQHLIVGVDVLAIEQASKNIVLQCCRS
jgi:coiled-coil and C2 domain-containing protein 2A